VVLLCQIDELWLGAPQTTVSCIIAEAGGFGFGVQLLNDWTSHVNRHVEDLYPGVEFFFGETGQCHPTVAERVDRVDDPWKDLVTFGRVFDDLHLAIDDHQHGFHARWEVIVRPLPALRLRHVVAPASVWEN
jgi:hypothetical protein